MGNGMMKPARKTKEQVDQEFSLIEARLIASTTFKWEQIKSELASEEEYNSLIIEVQAATSANESLGQLIARLGALGEGGVALAGKVKEFVLA